MLSLVLLFLAPRPAVALNDQLYPRQWGLEVIGAKTAWDNGLFGQDVDIAVLDTGVHLTHQDLVANLRPGFDVVEPNTPPQDDQCDGSDCGHGTHVAGIAAAAIDNGGSVGVAPRARIIPVKVLQGDGSGSTEQVAAGIRWAVANGAEVVNLSLGSDLQGLTGPADAIIAAVREAWAHGVICVFAAGNSFVLGSGFAQEPAIVVSATDRRDAEPDFSSGVGSARWGMAAPGGGNTVQFEADENIWSTAWEPSNRNDRYAEKRGTSMSAPFVSGAAALLRAAGLSPQATVDRLLQTAKDLGPAGRDSTFGSGRLDVARAVQGLSAPSAGTAGETGGGSSATTAPTTTARPGGGSAQTRPAPTTAPPATSPAPTTTPPAGDGGDGGAGNVDGLSAGAQPDGEGTGADGDGAGGEESGAGARSDDGGAGADGRGAPLALLLIAGAATVAVGAAVLLAVRRRRELAASAQ